MSGYPHAPPGHGYGQPPPGQGQPYTASPYASAPPQQGQGQPYSYAYSAPPPPQGHQQQYAAPSAPYAPSTKPPKEKPQSYGGDNPYSYGAPPQAYPPVGFGSPFASLVPSTFPPNTDPNVVACFQMADQDGSGLIDDKELQMALSSYNQGFSIRTVRLLIYLFTNSNSMKIGPKEFTALFYSLQSWRDIFERFDRDRSGKIDVNELRDALLSLGFAVSPAVLDLLVSKYDRSGGRNKAIEYDNFIECCLIVKGLTEKFKEKDTRYSGSATFTYENFMLTVLPFLMA